MSQSIIINSQVDPCLRKQVAQHPYALLFATISGAHLYGFPSPDSDFDLRGIHCLPLQDLLGLQVTNETVEKAGIHDGLEIDLVTHDVRKFFKLLLNKNGYVLEQLLSPLILHSTAWHQELVTLAPGCITKHHAHHYLGFAQTQWHLLLKKPRVKALLYVLRVLLTGIHLMRTGQIQANVTILNQNFKLGYIDELVHEKCTGREKIELPAQRIPFFQSEYQRLLSELENAHKTSPLPQQATATAAVNDLLLRIRLSQ